jgi:hypothetical protein
MRPKLWREIEYLNQAMVNGTIIAMEVKWSLEGEIQEGQLEDLKLMEIQQLIRDNKINDFFKDRQGTLWLGKQICVTNRKDIKELILTIVVYDNDLE